MTHAREVVTVALATALLAAALYFGPTTNIWLLTGIAGLLSLLLAWFLCRELLVENIAGTVGVTRQLALGTVVGLVMVVATEVGYRLLVPLTPEVASPVKELYVTLLAPPGPLFAFPVFLVVVFAEEVIWRGIAFGALEQTFGKRRFGRVVAVCLAVALYVLPQLANPVPFTMLVAAVCGALWTLQRCFQAQFTSLL